ncbi:hypothetical protein [Dactylosporangium sp. CA-139066]|uniref:hypothetical protein n=1 Tax=Dactylosporangium sp. CA-139066 TaxID=3239930 RepID=UPI003D8E113D
MKRHRSAALITAVATAATLVATAQPAQAADAYYEHYGNANCQGGYVCAWVWEDYSGYAIGFYNDAWDYASIPSAYRYINNNSRSWEDHGLSTYGNVRFFDAAGGSGRNKCLKKGYSVSRQADMNDLISAHVWTSTCSGYTLFSEQFVVWP